MRHVNDDRSFWKRNPITPLLTTKEIALAQERQRKIEEQLCVDCGAEVENNSQTRCSCCLVIYWESTEEKERKCRTCGIDISDRNPEATLCKVHTARLMQIERRKNKSYLRRENTLKRLGEKKKDKDKELLRQKRLCIYCETSISKLPKSEDYCAEHKYLEHHKGLPGTSLKTKRTCQLCKANINHRPHNSYLCKRHAAERETARQRRRHQLSRIKQGREKFVLEPVTFWNHNEIIKRKIQEMNEDTTARLTLGTNKTGKPVRRTVKKVRTSSGRLVITDYKGMQLPEWIQPVPVTEIKPRFR